MAQENTQKSLNLLYSVSRELSASLDLHVVLERILILCTRNVGAERGSIIAIDENKKPVDSALILNQKIINHTIYEIQGILDHGLAGWVLRNRRATLVSDTAHDKRWYRRPDDANNQTGPKSAVCIPMMLAGDQMVGVLTIVHPEPGFLKESHLSMLQAIADQAAITIFNAQLYQSLQMAELRYQELFEGSIDPVLVTTWKGEILEANRRAVEAFQLSNEELLTKSIFDLHQVDWEWLGEKSKDLHNNQTLHYTSEIKKPGENAIPVEVHIHKVDIQSAEYLQWIIHDISERKKLDKMRDDLSAMVYHDLRSPLANVISSMDMLNAFIPPDYADTAGQLIQIAVRSTRRVQHLISSLLDISRLENGQPIVNLEFSNLIDIAREAVEAVQANLEVKDQQLHFDIPENLPSLWLDKDMIKRVLINLIENAIKFAPFQGNIHLDGATGENTIDIWVQDDGPGIPVESREHVFEKFASLNAEKSHKGIGLGLAFCRLAVQAHGGRIWVDSPTQQGSRFIFTLPVSRSK
jgi:two-component system, NtrC family, sensor histidine kinase KinB